jgi:hypothetical protein
VAWIKTRVTDDGDKRFVACYRDPEGRVHGQFGLEIRRSSTPAPFIV